MDESQYSDQELQKWLDANSLSEIVEYYTEIEPIHILRLLLEEGIVTYPDWL